MEGVTVRVKDVVVLYLSRSPRAIRIGGAELIFDCYRGRRRVIASWRWGHIWSSRVVWFQK